MSTSTRTRIETVAKNHGWTVTNNSLTRRTHFERGEQCIAVLFDKRGGVTRVRVGKLGGREITGRGKALKIIGLLSRWEA